MVMKKRRSLKTWAALFFLEGRGGGRGIYALMSVRKFWKDPVL